MEDEAIRFFARDRDEYGWLSNFSPPPVLVAGVEWPTVEHYFQAMKVDERDPRAGELRAEIRRSKSPGRAKRLGRRAPLRPDWESVKEGVMLEALEAKFGADAELKEKLLATDDRELVEDSPYDSYWGTGPGDGKNRLGVLLMEVRRRLREGESGSSPT